MHRSAFEPSPLSITIASKSVLPVYGRRVILSLVLFTAGRKCKDRWGTNMNIKQSLYFRPEWYLVRFNPVNTAVPSWEQTILKLSVLSPKRDCSPINKRASSGGTLLRLLIGGTFSRSTYITKASGLSYGNFPSRCMPHFRHIPYPPSPAARASALCG